MGNYVLGTATATNAPLRLQNTVNPDGWESLGRAYGVPALEIIKMQPEMKGKAITNASVQAFVKSRPGWNAAVGLFAFDPKNNPGTKGSDGKPEGYAHFTNETQLMLPDMPRLDGKVPGGVGPLKPVIPDDTQEAGLPPIALLIGGAGLLLLILGRKKKKGTASSGG